MSLLSNTIERFIQEMLEESQNIELQRNDLAAYFGCAPSQINYVLSTRFSLDKGYVITSKRGGGGCIHVMRLCNGEGDLLVELITNRLTEEIAPNEAVAILDRLLRERLVSAREHAIMRAAVTNIPMVPRNIGGHVRAGLLKNMITELLRSDYDGM